MTTSSSMNVKPAAHGGAKSADCACGFRLRRERLPVATCRRARGAEMPRPKRGRITRDPSQVVDSPRASISSSEMAILNHALTHQGALHVPTMQPGTLLLKPFRLKAEATLAPWHRWPPAPWHPWFYLTVTVTGLNCSGAGAPSGVLATPLTWISEPPGPTASKSSAAIPRPRCARLVSRPGDGDVDTAGGASILGVNVVGTLPCRMNVPSCTVRTRSTFGLNVTVSVMTERVTRC